MAAYALQRLVALAAAMVGVASLTFVVFHVLPHQEPTPLDGPLPLELLEYLERVFLHFDLGRADTGTQRPVADLLAARLPGTLSLLVGAFVLAAVGGIAAGVVRATRPKSVVSRLLGLLFAFAVVAPPYWLGLMVLLLFTTEAGLVDVSFLGGQGSYRDLTEDPVRWLRSLILPWTLFAVIFAAFTARVLAATLRETLHEDYVRTARGKGVRERAVLWRHALRPALPAVLSVTALNTALFLNTAVLIETVFNIPGIGRMARDALEDNDVAVLEGTVLVAGAVVCVAGLLADLGLAWLDPQVRLARADRR